MDSPAPLLDLVVDDVTPECDDVLTLSLIDPDGGPLPAWRPGAHIDLHLPGGMIRQYSLSGDLDDPARYAVAVLRDPASRGGSAYLHDDVVKGTPLSASAPRNHFPLVEAREYLFIGGGIGITPIVPMMQAAEAAARPYTLIYAARSRRRMAFADRLAQNPSARLCVSEEGGRPDLTDVIHAGLADDVQLYCCGPDRLLDAVQERCDRLGLHRQLHVERFSGAVPALDPTIETAFDVELAATGGSVHVRADQSVLDALTDAGLKVPSSCAEGICGSCETAVLDGLVDHRDNVLDEEDRAGNEVMMICCSRARSPRLVLEL